MTEDDENLKGCPWTPRIHAFLSHTLAPEDAEKMESHIADCAECLHEFETLQPVFARFVSWPINDVPSRLWWRLARRIAAGSPPISGRHLTPSFKDPNWKEVAPGISCRLLSTDFDRDRVSMLVKLAPGVSYPSHTHAGVEELYLLEGELVINDRVLYAGEYNRAERGTSDFRVWSKTGCTCVLITSTRDELR